MSRFSHAVRLAVALAALGLAARPDGPIAHLRSRRGESAASMKPYVETIPGTEVKFEMVPIPGGTFDDGQPRRRGSAARTKSPQHPVQIAPFWMGK